MSYDGRAELRPASATTTRCPTSTRSPTTSQARSTAASPPAAAGAAPRRRPGRDATRRNGNGRPAPGADSRAAARGPRSLRSCAALVRAPRRLAVIVAAGGRLRTDPFFHGRDDATVQRAAAGPGRRSSPTRASDALVPRSGTVTTPTADERPARADARCRATASRSTDDQVLHALEVGDVVLAYASPARADRAARAGGRRGRPVRPDARRRRAGGRSSTACGRALERRRAALRLAPPPRRSRPANDPALREFAEFWLGPRRRVAPPYS